MNVFYFLDDNEDIFTIIDPIMIDKMSIIEIIKSLRYFGVAVLKTERHSGYSSLIMKDFDILLTLFVPHIPTC
jgi:hypothetical protein